MTVFVYNYFVAGVLYFLMNLVILLTVFSCHGLSSLQTKLVALTMEWLLWL